MHRVGVGGQVLDAIRLGFAAEKIDEVEADVAMRPLKGDQLRWRGERAILLLGTDDAILLHAAQHVGQALLGAVGMAVGIEIVRALEQACQHGAFGEREVLGRFAEIAARGHLHAPRAAPEVSGIEVELENLRLAQRVLEPRGDDHLADLALIGDVLADQEILHDLLRDGRAALRPARLGEIADEGADDAALVDAVMLEETPVLGGDESLLHEIGNGGERHPDAAVARLEHVGKISALAVEHHAQARQFPALQPGLVGQIGRRVIEKLDDLAEIDHRIGHALVLAELPVGGIEVGEIDAVKGLDVGAQRLRVVERGGNQAVQVDRFDIERLAHMGAAVAQNLHHFRLILPRVEVRLHRLRLGHHLAQRERGRENLDEDHVHAGNGGIARFEERQNEKSRI